MDANGIQLVFNDDANNSRNSELAFTPETSGTYYLNAHAWEDSNGVTSTGQYDLSIAVSQEIVGDKITDAVLTIGETVTSRIDFSGDEDWFAVELEAGQRYEFTLQGTGADGLNDPFLEIMGADGQRLGFNDDSNGTLNSTLFFTATQSGTYYLNAHGYVNDFGQTGTGDYVLDASLAEPIGSRTFQGVANFLVEEYSAAQRWAIDTISYSINGLTQGAQVLAELALSVWEEVSSLSFVRDETGNALLVFDDEESGAFASNDTGGIDADGFRIIESAFINVETSWDGGNTNIESYTYQTYIHEVGHALGLGHAGPYNGQATYGIDNVYTNDTWAYSVMSYFDQAETGFGNFRYVLGLQVADIIALQTGYGENPNGTRAGDTVYGFNSTESDVNDWSQFTLTEDGLTYLRPPSMAIYDTSGNDTVDLSGFSNPQILNLLEGSFSTLGDRADPNNPHYVNVISIGLGTIIENAIGGNGADTITGNSAANNIQGGSGEDELIGGGGKDLLFGEAGNDLLLGGNQDDRLSGGDGDDVLIGGGAKDRLNGDAGNDDLSGGFGADRLFGGSGNDTLTGGDGGDTFRFEVSGGSDADQVVDFSSQDDRVEVVDGDFASFAEVQAALSQSGSSTILTLSSGDTVEFLNTVISDFTASNLVLVRSDISAQSSGTLDKMLVSRPLDVDARLDFDVVTAAETKTGSALEQPLQATASFFTGAVSASTTYSVFDIAMDVSGAEQTIAITQAMYVEVPSPVKVSALSGFELVSPERTSLDDMFPDTDGWLDMSNGIEFDAT
ncbi:MAG: Serralysin C [Hyphomonas sp. TMED17]|nr:MAG: Serralysin C [Hyphomonas sp. TMED17]